MKARIIRYDARHSYHAPAALLADFAVFDIHSRSGVRLKDGTASPAQSPRCRVHQQISGRRDHDLRRRPENVPTVTIWLEHHRHRTIRPADGVYVVLRAGHTKPRPRCRRSGRPRAAVARLTGPGVRHRSHPSAVACTAPGHRRVLSGKAVLVAGRALAVAVTLEPRPANEASGTHDAVGGGDLPAGQAADLVGGLETGLARCLYRRADQLLGLPGPNRPTGLVRASDLRKSRRSRSKTHHLVQPPRMASHRTCRADRRTRGPMCGPTEGRC